MPLGLQKVKLEPHVECRVPGLSQSKTVIQLNDCRVYNAKTNIKMERDKVETGMICVKVEAEHEMNFDPKAKKTKMDTVSRLVQNLRSNKMQNEPFSAVKALVKQATKTPSARKGRNKHVPIVQTRLLPVPIKPKIVPGITVPDQQEKLEVTKPSKNKLQRSKESIPVTDASDQYLKMASIPSGNYMQNQASLQQPVHLYSCPLGQPTVSSACQNPVFIQVSGSQLANSSFKSANQLTCHPVVLPQNSVSIQLAANTVAPGISMMPGNLSLSPQLQLQSSGSLVNSQGSLQIGIPPGQIVQMLNNSFIPNHGNLQNPIHIQIPTNQVIQPNSQNLVQFNFPSSQLIQSNIQNPMQLQIPSTHLVHSGSPNIVQINGPPSNHLVQNSIQTQLPARKLLQNNKNNPGPMLLPSMNSNIEIKRPVFIKAKLPKESVTILPSSPLIKNSIGHSEVQNTVRTNLLCNSQLQSLNTRRTRSKPLSKVAKVGRKPRKSKYSTRGNTSSKMAAQTQRPVSIQPYSTGTLKFTPIQPSINPLPQQHASLQNSLQVQVVNRNVLNAVHHQFPLQLGIPLRGTMSNPSIIETPAVVQVSGKRLETSKPATSTFRIVPATSGATIQSHVLYPSKSLARTKLRGRTLQQITTKHSASEYSRSCRIATRQSNTSVFSQKRKSVLPKQDPSKTNNLQHLSLGYSGYELKQSALPDCRATQQSYQLTVPVSSLPTYTFVTSSQNLQPNTNLPNAQILRTSSQTSAHSTRSLQGVLENNKSQDLDISSKETIIVLGASNLKKSSDAQRFSVSNIVNSSISPQSTSAVPQRKAKSKYVPILPRSSDNKMCIFNQTADDQGCFWGAGYKKRKLASKGAKQTATMVQASHDNDEQELLASQKCFVPLEMLNVEPNKFYSVSDFKS